MILATIPGTKFQLDAPAELSWQRMIAAGSPGAITTAYRDSNYQAQLYAGWLARLPGFNFALPPGKSKHELGIAVDVDPATANWLAAHGAAFGWARPTGWREWWHFEYTAANDTRGNSTQEDEMTPDQARQLEAVYNAIFKMEPLSTKAPDGSTIPSGLLGMVSMQQGSPSSAQPIDADGIASKVIAGIIAWFKRS